MTRYAIDFYVTFFAIVLAVIFMPMSAHAGSTPPETSIVLTGTMGGGGWYVSTVDVSLRSTDSESGPASTSYRLNGGTWNTNEYSTESNALLNPSFEDGWTVGINHWQPVSSDPTALSQSSIAFSGYRSAEIITSNNSEYRYWTNYNDYVSVLSGKTYTITAQVKTFNLAPSTGAWMEAWALDSSGVNGDYRLDWSPAVSGDTEWSLQAIEFVVPSGYDGVYIKLGAQAEQGVAWFDDISMRTGNDAITQFLIHQNGNNTLDYYSTDNNGNAEMIKTRSDIKVDTVSPQDWSEFRWNITGNNHTYTAFTDIRDVSSGVVPESAQYRWYDASNCNCWGAWTNVETITRLDNGGPVSSGYTGFVTLKTHSTDLGDSGVNTLPKVQFRINDVATALAMSPEYSLFGPWATIRGGGDVYVNGRLDGLGPTPIDEYAAHGVVVAGDGAYALKSYYDWLVQPYQHKTTPIASLEDFFPKFSQIRARAVLLPNNRLPTSTGTYFYSGNYTIDRNSLSSGFTSNTHSSIVIIEGNLYINEDFQLHKDSAVAFLVEGDVIFSENTNQTHGFIFAVGDINTNSTNSQSGKADDSLTHNGGFIAGQDIILGRNLGKNKNDQPAEIINFPVQYLVNPTFAGLFGNPDASIVWQEVLPGD